MCECSAQRAAKNQELGPFLSGKKAEELIKFYEVKSVPKQTDGYNCGPFVLTYMDFFAYLLPDEISLFDGDLVINFGNKVHPTFMSPRWFKSNNPGHMRTQLSVQVLERFKAEVSASGDACVINGVNKFLREATEHAEPYVSPAQVMDNSDLQGPEQIHPEVRYSSHSLRVNGSVTCAILKAES